MNGRGKLAELWPLCSSVEFQMPKETFPLSSLQSPDSKPKIKADGFALLSVLFVMVLLSVTAVPLLNLAARQEKSARELRILSYLNQEAKENLEIGIYLIKLSGGIPDKYVPNGTGLGPKQADLASRCNNRIEAIDPEILGGLRLDSVTDPVWHSAVTTSSQRWGSVFMTNVTPTHSYSRLVVIACTTAANGGLAVHAAEIVEKNGGYYTLSSGQY